MALGISPKNRRERAKPIALPIAQCARFQTGGERSIGTPPSLQMIKIEVQRPQAASVPTRFALWNLGFRPFYLLASIFASSSILLWICQYAGQLPATYLRSPAWHGHEMLFGYTMAVVAGFLLTAVANWTGKPTPSGPALIALVALWMAGRVLVLTPYATAAAIANVVFPLALAIGIGKAVVQSRNRRNYFFLGLLLLLGFAVLAFHLSHLGLLPWPERASLQAGLDVILFIMAVIGGRVIPMFTNNGIPGAQATRHPLVEKSALAWCARIAWRRPSPGSRLGRCSACVPGCVCARGTTLPVAAMANWKGASGVGAARRLRLDCCLPAIAWTG